MLKAMMALVAIGTSLLGFPALAEVGTYTIDVSASDFQDLITGGPAAPEPSFSAEYIITFDPAVGMAANNRGIEVISVTPAIPFGESSASTLWGVTVAGLGIGTDIASAGDCNTASSSNFMEVHSYCVQINYATQPFKPTTAKVYYSDGIFEFSSEATVSLAPVPEPSTWGLMIAGLGGIGLMLRRRRRDITIQSKGALRA